MRHGAAAYVKRCILHQQENLTLWLLAVLQVTHLIGTGSSANYIPNTFLRLVALMDTDQKWREFWKDSNEQSSWVLSTQEAHGPHLGFVDHNEILIGISGNTSVYHNPTIFSQNELQWKNVSYPQKKKPKTKQVCAKTSLKAAQLFWHNCYRHQVL